MRRWLPFGLLLAVLGLVAWRWIAVERGVDPAAGSLSPTGAAGTERTLLASNPMAKAASSSGSRDEQRITGRVLDGETPVRARVELRSVGDGPGRSWQGNRWETSLPTAAGAAPPVAVLESDEEGRFAFVPVAEGRFVVVALSTSGARGWAPADTRLAPQRGTGTDVLVRVRGGNEVLRGRVLHADRRPWRGSIGVADAAATDWPSEALRVVATDEEGRFEVGHLPPGPTTVDVLEPPRVRFVGRAVVLPRAAALEIVLPAPGPEVRCLVKDAATGRPIPGAQVSANLSYALDSVVEGTFMAVTDAGGEARLPTQPDGIWAQATGYEPVWVSTSDLAPTVEVRLRVLHAVDVLVVEAGTKAPVFGADVICMGSPFVPHRSQRTDAAGRCRLTGLAEGDATILVHGGGWCSVELVAARGVAAESWPDELGCNLGGSDAAIITREVVRLAVVAGRVLDAKDQPVAGARISVSERALPTSLVFQQRTAPLTSGPDGAYEGALLVPGRSYDLRVDAPGHATSIGGPVASAIGERVVHDVRFEGGRLITVRFVEEGSRRPIPGATATAAVQVDAHHLSESARSDIHGLARLGPLPRGTTTVFFSASGFTGPHFEDLSQDASEDVELEVVLTRADLRVAGRVRFEDGTSPRDVHLQLADSIKGAGFSVDDAGQFLVEGLTPGAHTLLFGEGDVEDVLLVRVVTAGDAAIEVVLPTPKHRGISFRVLGADGSALSGCDSVNVVGVRSDQNWADRGFLRVPPFAGTIWVLFYGPQGEGGRPLGWAPTAFGPIVGDGRTHEVRMRAGQPASGHVVDEEGRGLAGVQVNVTALTPPISPDPTMQECAPEYPSTVTDARGQFTFIGLDETPHQVEVDPPDGFAPPAPAVVRGGDSGLRIVLARPTEAELRVVDPAGLPVPGAVVRAPDDDDLRPIDRTDATGRTRVTGLAPDRTIWLSLDPPLERTDLRKIERMAWRAGDPPIVLPAARAFRGTVVDEAGKPVPRADVVVIDAEGERRQQPADGEGRVHVRGLASGPVEAIASTVSLPGLISSRVRSLSESDEARLVLARGATLRVRVTGVPFDLTDEEVDLTSVDGAPAEATVSIGPDGFATFEGLDPRGSYSFLFSLPPKWAGVVRDIRSDAGEVTLELGPARALTGVVRGAPLGSPVWVSIDEHGLSIDASVRSDGVFALADVPSGPFTVQARCETPTGVLVGSARGSTAAPVEIELGPAPAAPR